MKSIFKQTVNHQKYKYGDIYFCGIRILGIRKEVHLDTYKTSTETFFEIEGELTELIINEGLYYQDKFYKILKKAIDEEGNLVYVVDKEIDVIEEESYKDAAKQMEKELNQHIDKLNDEIYNLNTRNLWQRIFNTGV